jgi:hypothetical protein
MSSSKRGTTIQPAIRERIAQRADALLGEIDELNRNPSQDAVDQTRNSADALLRAVARVLIELSDEGP